MMPAGPNPKLTPDRLARKAIVYLRQSSERQVQQNLESQRLQYALADRARALGWTQVEVIDSDLGWSAAMGAAPREGFARLLASVALGEVGLVLSREVSRLSRTDKDWCHLLEVCQLFDTLIGDAEQVYDVSLIDDQLVLGIKGTLSVVELKVLKLRLLQGMEAKARRGELIRILPPGYVTDGTGKVVKDPNVRVQEAMALIFRTFRETWSIRQTFKWFHAQGIELPVTRKRDGRVEVVFQLPTHSFIGHVLRNPIYAGAYVYGRRPVELTLVDGRPRKRHGRLRPPTAARVFIPDHHDGYIDWATYDEHQRMMRRNSLRHERAEGTGGVRAGHGLLARLLRCGRCGRKLHVWYWGKHGTAARYLCVGDFPAGGRYCLGFGGATVDRRIGEEVVRVLSPLGVRASLEALEQRRATDAARRDALARQFEQAEYEARRASEQYHAVDARNRLVAAELERRWNVALEHVERLRSALAELEQATPALSEEERVTVRTLGERFADVWHSPACPPELRKKIVRTVLDEIIVTHDEATDTLRFTLHWAGGTHTALEMPKPRSGVGQATALEDLELIRRMAGRYGDDEIARVLNKLGRRTGKGKRWSQERVATARRNHGIAGQTRAAPDPEILSLGRAAKEFHVSDTTIKRLVASGLLTVAQVAPWAPWEIRRADLDADPIRGILEHLRRTGELVLPGMESAAQPSLFQ
jgi:DNA invertase Pin-like site-specific DNA recombinase